MPDLHPQQEQQPHPHAASDSFLVALTMVFSQHFWAFSASTTCPQPQAHFQYGIINTSIFLSASHMKHFSYKLIKRFEYINIMVRISDLELVEALRENARVSFTSLARRFSVTETAVRKRVRKLEAQGVIRKYTIDADMRKLGFQGKATIGVDTKPESYLRTLDALKRMRLVSCLCSCSGDHMMMVDGWFRDTAELGKFVKALEAMDGVTKVCPAIVGEKVK
jgi:Lrp/AsnC family transcriptional regulator, regulator for asnA, asnC and gidA